MKHALVLVLATACGDNLVKPITDRDVPFDGTFCTLPGTFVHDGDDRYHINGGPEGPRLDWLTIPDGFCMHYFDSVPSARQIKFAPSGELFVASPSRGTAGGAPKGVGAIVVLADDDHDGQADAHGSFLDNIEAVQGLLFTGGFLYYQDDTKIRRTPYTAGQRTGLAGEQMVDIDVYVSTLHWPKVMDVADDGTIFVTNGGDQGEMCDPTNPLPFHGGILKLDGSVGGAQVMKGFRNPIAIRCLPGKGSCWVAELSLDASGGDGGREKIVPVHDGDNYGFPCCATQNLPFPGISPPPDCSTVVPEANAFEIGDTPFGIDFEVPHKWPAPYTGALFVALHGKFGTWEGSRVVAIGTDPTTGAPLPSSDIPGGPNDALHEFAGGWDDGKQDHGRPAAVAIADDGRVFVANDADGSIIWFAPLGLADPTSP
jgi:glucose/arabinose dehydrogenase